MLKTKKGQELDATKIILHSANEIYQQKKRKASSKSPKINVVSKNKKFQTIFIEADGLSNNQIR